jgi:hypothetical protein
VGLSFAKATLVGVYAVALLAFVAIGVVRPNRRFGRFLVVAAVGGSLGGLTLSVAVHVLNVGGETVALMGAALLPIGGGAAGAVAVNDPARADGARTRLRQLGIGLASLGAGILVVVGWPMVDWLTMVSWGLPALVLATGGLVSAASTLERRS